MDCFTQTIQYLPILGLNRPTIQCESLCGFNCFISLGCLWLFGLGCEMALFMLQCFSSLRMLYIISSLSPKKCAALSVSSDVAEVTWAT